MAIKYTTSDGKSFPTEADAVAHEATLERTAEMRKSVQTYVELQSYTGVASERGLKAAQGRLANTIMAYLTWVDAGSPSNAQPAADTGESMLDGATKVEGEGPAAEGQGELPV